MRISDWSSDVCSSDLIAIEKAADHIIGLARAAVPGTEFQAFEAVLHGGPFNLLDRFINEHSPDPFVSSPSTALQALRINFGLWPKSRHREGMQDRGARSEEHRVGKECVSTCRSRGAASHLKKKQKLKHQESRKNK